MGFVAISSLPDDRPPSIVLLREKQLKRSVGRHQGTWGCGWCAPQLRTMWFGLLLLLQAAMPGWVFLGILVVSGRKGGKNITFPLHEAQGAGNV